jgi:hypothetical protein
MSALDRLKLLGDRADPLTRWQAEAELQTEAEQRQQRSKDRERSAMAESEQVQALRHEIAALRNHIAEREQANSENMVEIARAVREVVDQIPDWIKAAVRKSDAALRVLIAERFGEALGRIAAIDPAGARTAKGEFKFANEREQADNAITELPNPLPPRRAIN